MNRIALTLTIVIILLNTIRIQKYYRKKREFGLAAMSLSTIVSVVSFWIGFSWVFVFAIRLSEEKNFLKNHIMLLIMVLSISFFLEALIKRVKINSKGLLYDGVIAWDALENIEISKVYLGVLCTVKFSHNDKTDKIFFRLLNNSSSSFIQFLSYHEIPFSYRVQE